MTNDVVETFSRHGVVVDSIDVNSPDDDLVVYCFCGHEESSHDGESCRGCADDLDHGVDSAHAFRTAT